MKLPIPIRWITIPLITTVVLLGGYYTLLLKPSLALPIALLDTQANLGQFHEALLQNRIALTELTRLDSTSTDFFDEKQRSLSRLKETSQQAQSLAQNPPTLSNKVISRYRELEAAYPILIEKTSSILSDQQTLIEKLEARHENLKNIYLYDPVIDLSSLDVSTADDREELLGRLNAALEGLDAIKTSRPTRETNADSLIVEISATQGLIDQLISQLENSELDDANQTRIGLIQRFGELKNAALESELALIKSEDSISLLTRLTNLILEYEFHMQKMSAMLKDR